MRARGLSVVGLVACRRVGVRAVEVPEVVERVLPLRGVLDALAVLAVDVRAHDLGLDLVNERVVAGPVSLENVDALLHVLGELRPELPAEGRDQPRERRQGRGIGEAPREDEQQLLADALRRRAVVVK